MNDRYSRQLAVLRATESESDTILARPPDIAGGEADLALGTDGTS